MTGGEKLALVTGSSGHVGGWVVRTLLEHGFRVRGLDLSPPPRGFLPYTERFESVTGDVCDRDLVRHASRDARAVFHLAMLHAQHLKGERADRELTRIAIEGLDAVIDAIRAAGSGVRLVYTSTAGAVGETRDPERPRTEEDWNDEPITAYARAKIAAERRLWQRSDEVDAVALLPGMTVGPDDPYESASNSRIEQMYRRAWVPLWFEGGLNVADVRDVALAHLLAFERGERGRRYLIGGQNLTFRDLSRELRQLRGLGGSPSLRVPDRALLTAVRAYELFCQTAGKKPAVTRAQVDKRLGSYAYIASDRARAELGYSPRPLDETLRDLVQPAPPSPVL